MLSSLPILDAAVALVADYACETGENPIWHPFERKLYWCDIPRGRIFRFDPSTDTHEQCYEGRVVGGFTIQADGSLLLFMDKGTIAIWRDGMLTEVVPSIPREENSRFNDVIADPTGRVLCGTMSTETQAGALYRLDLDGSVHLLIEGVLCSNGMAFTADAKGFYHTDSFAREISYFDYSMDDGSISNRRTFVRFAVEDGLPDGMTRDENGDLWCALWDGGCVVQISADGTQQGRILVPAPKSSSVAFGGPGYKDLYITTAGGNIRETDGNFAGALFRVRGGVSGVPDYLSQIGIS
jgi:sugar lactone lactonase YvrE